MFDTISAEVWAQLQREWGMIAAAPVSFTIAVVLATAITGWATYLWAESRSGEQRAIMQATIEHQRELLAGHRDREEKAKETIAEITKRPEFHLILLGMSTFTPDQAPGITGINIAARLWNTGAPSIAIAWSLVLLPNGRVPILAQYTMKPETLRAAGDFQSSIMRASGGLDVKTSTTPVGEIPIDGDILFYARIPSEVIKHPETWIEMSVKDKYERDVVAKQKVGDWLGIRPEDRPTNPPTPAP
jgi:hypothetical protein